MLDRLWPSCPRFGETLAAYNSGYRPLVLADSRRQRRETCSLQLGENPRRGPEIDPVEHVTDAKAP